METDTTKSSQANQSSPELPAKHTFTVIELAGLLGVNHKTIREQITAGAIKAIRLGR